MSLSAEILAIGTELLLGDILNTDAQFVARGLGELGINTFWQSVVGDNPQRIKDAVLLAKSRADILITTGGLGPTYDDITKETVSECYGRKLVRHDATIERIKTMFAVRGIQFTDNQQSQAMLPESCTVLENDWGTAPGVAFEADGKVVVMLPGPPSECEPMWRERAVPYLAALSDACLVSRNIKVVGLGEAQMESLIRDEIETMTNPTAAPYTKVGECLVRVTAKAVTRGEAYAMTEPVVARLCEKLGGYVYGVDVDSLEAAVLELLCGKGLTLAVAESCTGGMLGSRLVSVSGASDVFLGGVICYANELKSKIVGVPEELIASHGAVSAQVAEAMAEGVRALAGASIGVAVTGVAGPSESEHKPVGLVYIAVSGANGTEVIEKKFGRTGGRERVRSLSATNALDLVRKYVNAL